MATYSPLKVKAQTPGQNRHSRLRFRSIKLAAVPGPVRGGEEDLPYAQFLGDFFSFLRDERGLAETTINGHKRSLKLFLSWLNRVGVQLRDVSPKTISTYFSSEVAGRWKRVTVSGHVQYLRNFFRHAGQRGWCAKGIADP